MEQNRIQIYEVRGYRDTQEISLVYGLEREATFSQELILSLAETERLIKILGEARKRLKADHAPVMN